MISAPLIAEGGAFITDGDPLQRRAMQS
jgi:hypothetical protein